MPAVGKIVSKRVCEERVGGTSKCWSHCVTLMVREITNFAQILAQMRSDPMDPLALKSFSHVFPGSQKFQPCVSALAPKNFSHVFPRSQRFQPCVPSLSKVSAMCSLALKSFSHVFPRSAAILLCLRQPAVHYTTVLERERSLEKKKLKKKRFLKRFFLKKNFFFWSPSLPKVSPDFGTTSSSLFCVGRRTSKKYTTVLGGGL